MVISKGRIGVFKQNVESGLVWYMSVEQLGFGGSESSGEVDLVRF